MQTDCDGHHGMEDSYKQKISEFSFQTHGNYLGDPFKSFNILYV